MLYFEVFLLLKNVEQLHKEQRVDYFYVRQSISSILMDWASICSSFKSSQIRFYSCANKCWYRTKSVSVCPSLILRRPRSFAVPFASSERDRERPRTSENQAMYAHIVTQERTLLGERTIVGPRSVKDAVKFYDPENLSLRADKIKLWY